MVEVAPRKVDYRRVSDGAELKVSRIGNGAAVERYPPDRVRRAVYSVHHYIATPALDPAALFSDYGGVDAPLPDNIDNRLFGYEVDLARHVASCTPAHLPACPSSPGKPSGLGMDLPA